jgi:hypothetical protein
VREAYNNMRKALAQAQTSVAQTPFPPAGGVLGCGRPLHRIAPRVGNPRFGTYRGNFR